MPRRKFRNYMHEKIDRWSYDRVTGLLSKNGITLALHDRDRPWCFKISNGFFNSCPDSAEDSAGREDENTTGKRCALGSMRYLVVLEALEDVAKTSGGSVFNNE